MKQRSMANLGSRFEELIEWSCIQYDERGIATIEKVDTQWKPIREKGKIVSAKVKKKSTVDFKGAIFQPIGLAAAVAFEAKSTDDDTFNLRNIKDHQIRYLLKWTERGAIGFFLVEFTKLNEVYRVPVAMMREWLLRGKYAAIKIDEFRKSAVRLQLGKNGIALDFLDGLKGVA